MGLPQIDSPISAADYLAWEEEQPEKSEYVCGEIFPMDEFSRRHVMVCGNVASTLHLALEETGWRVYASQMKLRVLEDEAYFYPDVLVTCDPADHRADQFMSAPTVVVEVLSPSTAAFDRGDKFALYRQIPSLKEFVLIDPEKRRIECYRRGEQARWELEDIAPDGPLRLQSLDAEVPWERIFRNAD
ncbi:Uma2 family endonuclease [Thiorhodococcus minor]|uniref:Uma2 family endonuclease n=1 Tax=Thiorhodococcus minor TaxID=57489 RepID=A0A6M0K0J3_9GAMM|nr:Uma2 family endonuclease [Thiorhodococcus minor]NEV62117.1 Uma2 family endonuclease [Thiorhodococcus minor]